MFDVGFSELMLLAIVALVVIGPERLPHAARVAGAWIGRIKRTVSSMQAEIEREVSAQELRERLEKEIAAVREHDALSAAVDEPLAAIRAGLDEARQELAAVETGQPLIPAGTADAASVLPPAAAAAVLPLAAEAVAATPVLPPASAAGQDPEPALAGEAAYREWLAAQKSRNLQPAAPAPGNDESAPS